MSYHFIETHRQRHSVRRACQLLTVSVSGYYAWRTRRESARSAANRALLEDIRAIHDHSRRTYGSPRVHAELKARGLAGGRHRVARLMRRAGIKARMSRLWSAARGARTDEHIEANKLNRAFTVAAPNRRWVADITHIATAQGWLYLSAVMDLYSRRIVGWSMASRPGASLSTEAVTMALGQRHPVRGLLLHSDQGMHYRTAAYHHLLEDHGIESSMSRVGNCLDNAAMESFFHTLKTEHVHHHRYRTRDEARQSLFEYIEVFYNRQRRHSTLNYMTPMEYERYHQPSP